jgi:signal transduction histidine kinase
MVRSRLDLACWSVTILVLVIGWSAWWRLPPPDRPAEGGTSMLALWLASAILAVCAWRQWTVPDSPDTRYLPSLALAASLPLSMVPLTGISDVVTALVLMSATLGMLPFASAFSEGIPSRGRRWSVRVGMIAAASAALVLSVGAIAGDGLVLRAWWWLAVALAVGIPTIAFASEILRPGRGWSSAPGPRVEALVVVLLGVVPILVALGLATPAWPLLLVPVFAAAVTIALMSRYLVQPLAVLLSTSGAQRDRLVEATEAERRRLASELHDGPLAEVTLLVQWLDQRGEQEGAAFARSIASELRAIGGELRLPVLDDLGAGPALEWLVGRLTQRSGVDISLEEMTLVRPPAAVELATYRVAQEALVNAIRHGAPPVTVRYSADAAEVSLCVEDAGPGIDGPRASASPRPVGTLGLPSMLQRAEAIGARLTIGSRPDGGARIELVWHPTAVA